ncbi:MAG: hypothetical protein Q4F58_02610 [Candidatus Saccharibacteria bacterium]|nr:hypothetical protein [Candidatus Saccharibacteria bacterium]
MKKIYIFLTMLVGAILGLLTAEKVEADGLPEFYIKAVNPGYTIDGVLNVGEMIEIGRKNSDTPISLAGLTLGYTNSSGNTAVLADFSKYIWTDGETILLMLASSPGSELAGVRYSKTLAFKAGPLNLMRGEEVLDSVCWTGKDECVAAFNSSNPTTLVRDLETGEFGHVSNYEPSYGGVLLEEAQEDFSENVASQCKGVEFSEVLSYYETLPSEQFIELFNHSAENINLDGCLLKYKNKYYPLSGMMAAEGYLAWYLSDFKLTKNPATSNTIELIDANGEVLDKLIYINGQRKGTSYALIGYDNSGAEIWRVTYAPTPGGPNNYQEFKTCEEGKVLNEATGNCVKATAVSEKVCKEGYYLNILTGRCRKIPEDTGVKECKEGYYLNEETGRCKKLKNNDGASYALVPETYSESSNFVALWLVLGVVLVGLVYVGYEFRREIFKVIRKIWK